MRRFVITAVAAWTLSEAATAADYVIDQKDLNFSQAEISIAKGDKIKFTNRDRTAHHVWSKDNGVNIASPTLKVGQSYEVKFDKAGTYTIKCYIHPKMKMIVIVK